MIWARHFARCSSHSPARSGRGRGGGSNLPGCRIDSGRVENRHGHRFQISHHIIVGDPQHLETARLKVRGALRVLRCSPAMTLPVDLNDELAARTIEVNNVSADCLLSAEPQALELLVPQQVPKDAFGVRRAAPQRSGPLGHRWRDAVPCRPIGHLTLTLAHYLKGEGMSAPHSGQASCLAWRRS